MDNSSGGTDDDRNTPRPKTKSQTQNKVRRVGKDEALRRGKLIESIGDGKALHKDKVGRSANDGRVERWRSIDSRGEGGACWVNAKGTTM